MKSLKLDSKHYACPDLEGVGGASSDSDSDSHSDSNSNSNSDSDDSSTSANSDDSDNNINSAGTYDPFYADELDDLLAAPEEPSPEPADNFSVAAKSKSAETAGENQEPDATNPDVPDLYRSS